MPELHMTSLTLDAIACKEEEAVVVDYIMRGKPNSLLWYRSHKVSAHMWEACVNLEKTFSCTKITLLTGPY